MEDKNADFKNKMALSGDWSVVFALKGHLCWSRVECSQIPHSFFQPGGKTEVEVRNV